MELQEACIFWCYIVVATTYLQLLRATGKPYHPACFTCVVCGKSLDGIPFTVDATNQIHCIEDFHRLVAAGYYYLLVFWIKILFLTASAFIYAQFLSSTDTHC